MPRRRRKKMKPDMGDQQELYGTLNMPAHKVMAEEAQFFSPSHKRIKDTRVTELDNYFMEVFEKHHPSANYLDTFRNTDGEDE